MQKQEHCLSKPIFIMQHTGGKHLTHNILTQVHAKSIACAQTATYDTLLHQPIGAALHKHGNTAYTGLRE